MWRIFSVFHVNGKLRSGLFFCGVLLYGGKLQMEEIISEQIKYNGN
jgi:hypothetical protein